MAVGTSYLVTLIIIILLLASLAFPRTFALPNRTDLGTTAGKKESCCWSWFFQKAPYLCTPPRINRICCFPCLPSVATKSCHWGLEIKIKYYLCTPNNTNRVFFTASETNEAKINFLFRLPG